MALAGENRARAVVTWFARYRLFILIALTYAYFFQGSDPNQASRYFVAQAIVERGALDITPNHARTIDKGHFDGKFYSDKAPGVSLLSVVPYAVMNVADRIFHLDPRARPVQRARLHMLVIATSVASGTLAAWFVWNILRRLGSREWQASLLTFGYALGTLAFPFSTVLFGHQTAAALLIATFWLILKWDAPGAPLSRSQHAALGFLWATCFIVEYPTALLAAAIGVYLVSLHPRVAVLRTLVPFVALGAVLPLAVHSAYLYAAFGSPVSLPYKHLIEPIFLAHTSSGFLGIGLPTRVGSFGSLFSRYRGLFFYCPMLILTLFGFRSWILSRERGREAALTFAVVTVSFLFTASYYAWDGGGSTGPRHMIPALPFFILPIGYFLRQARGGVAFALLGIIPSVLVMTACTAVCVELPEADPYRANPLYQIVIPRLFRGFLSLNGQDLFQFGWRRDAAYNLGTLFNVSPLASLFIPAFAWCAAYAPSLLERKIRS